MTSSKSNMELKPVGLPAKNQALRLFESVSLKDANAVLEVALKHFGSRVALASSFSMEDTILIDMLVKIDADARILALDTGRLNEETHECAEKIRLKYGCRIEWFFPDNEAVESLVRTKGSCSFKESIENRKECCLIRKVLPLERALNGLHAWVTGQRRQQSSTREDLQVLEVDQSHGGILKINPLALWSADQVKEYVEANNIPYNRLYDHGYQSIGCAPCTRAPREGEDERAGRWWWEDAAHKECGIHLVKSTTSQLGNKI
jgi:phosphoadenosine phosphosulfate reductase